VAFHGLLFGAPPTEATMVATYGSGDPGIHARWLTRDAAGVHAADAGPATQLSGATDPVLALTRGAAGAGVTLPGQAGRYLATSVGAPV
jgi:hypothetical protein